MKILIAGIGNIFQGDDAFGCEVIRALNLIQFSKDVTVRDFGIRSYDLAYALAGDYDLKILVDAVPQRKDPGTVYLIEPELDRLQEMETTGIDPHRMDPVAVIQMAQSLGPIPGKIYVVGCEPAVLENEQGEMTLSEPVRNAIPDAVKMILSLLLQPDFLNLTAPAEPGRN